MTQSQFHHIDSQVKSLPPKWKTCVCGYNHDDPKCERCGSTKTKQFTDPDLEFKQMQEAGYRWPEDIKQDEYEQRNNQEKRL